MFYTFSSFVIDEGRVQDGFQFVLYVALPSCCSCDMNIDFT